MNSVSQFPSRPTRRGHRVARAGMMLSCCLVLLALSVGTALADPPTLINVEVDYMVEEGESPHSHILNQAEVDAMVQVFACQGITLNVEVSDAVPHVDVLIATPTDTVSEDALGYYIKHYFDHRGELGWHYCLMAHRYGSETNSSVGFAMHNGYYFAVTLGGQVDEIGTPFMRASTFVHELGHNLGLEHSGDQDQGEVGPQKPNYPSVMNYRFGRGIKWMIYCFPPYMTENLDNLANLKLLDYSHGLLPDLYDTELYEIDGIGYGPVDWNGNGSIDTEPVSCDIAWTFGCGLPGRGLLLKDYDDWSNIVDYTWVEKGAKPPSQRIITCATLEDLQKIASALEKYSPLATVQSRDYCDQSPIAVEVEACVHCVDVDGDGHGDPGVPDQTCPLDNCATVYNPGQEDTDGDGIGDVCDVEAPVLISPEDRAYFSGGPIVLIPMHWHPAALAQEYQIHAARNEAFTDGLIPTIWTPDTIFGFNLNEGVWYWRIHSRNNDLQIESEWSQVWSFGINQPAAPRDHVTPAEGSETTDDTPRFRWTSVGGVTGYNIEIDTCDTFAAPFRTDADGTFSYDTTFNLSSNRGLPVDTYYWRVRGYNATETGPWSNVTSFLRKNPNPPSSCPVLFTYYNGSFREENTLLTACEESGWVDVVTDYYHLRYPLDLASGDIVIQIRELEDEITYLHGLELITADHSHATRIACAVDGNIIAYDHVVAPLTVVDHTGVDRLSEVAEEDGVIFASAESGHLIVTFPAIGDRPPGIAMNPIDKPLCKNMLKPQPDSDVRNAMVRLTLERLDEHGDWITLSSPPPREHATGEIVLCDAPGGVDTDVITLRLSWVGQYATDVIRQVIPADEQPRVRTYAAEHHEVTRKSTADTEGSLDGTGPVVLRKGDILDVRFSPNAPLASGDSRDYIIRAVGRYSPDYAVYTHLMPDRVQLYNNYPNPFNPLTTIGFSLPEPANVTLAVFNTTGQRVATLVDSRLDAGEHTATFDGSAYATGVYFYRLEVGDQVVTKKMVLLK